MGRERGNGLRGCGVRRHRRDRPAGPSLHAPLFRGLARGPNNVLLPNPGNTTFLEESESCGVNHAIFLWGTIFFDFDNDP